ncbi:hypothetical protein Tco_0115758 [Tanacetum coccineum]
MHEGPIHEVTLYVVAGDWGYEREIDRIISHLSSKKMVKKLTIDFVYCSWYRHHSLPISLFSMSQLTDLYLNYCDLSHEPRFNWLKCRRKSQVSWLPSSGLGSLTSLYVQKSRISIQTLIHILSNYPLLKSVTLKTDEFYDCGGATSTNLFESLKMVERFGSRDKSQKNTSTGSDYISLPQMILYRRLILGSITDDSRDEDDPCSRLIEDYSDIRLEHLREFEITNLSSTKTELNIVKLILMRLPVLRKLRIHIADVYKVNEMLISETLLSAPRASPVVSLLKMNPFNIFN